MIDAPDWLHHLKGHHDLVGQHPLPPLDTHAPASWLTLSVLEGSAPLLPATSFLHVWPSSLLTLPPISMQSAVSCNAPTLAHNAKAAAITFSHQALKCCAAGAAWHLKTSAAADGSSQGQFTASCLLVQVIRHLDAALTEQPGTYRLQAQLTEAAAGLLEVAEGRVQTWIRFLLDQEGAPGE